MEAVSFDSRRFLVERSHNNHGTSALLRQLEKHTEIMIHKATSTPHCLNKDYLNR